jgi:hypothetical protein
VTQDIFLCRTNAFRSTKLRSKNGEIVLHVAMCRLSIREADVDHEQLYSRDSSLVNEGMS